MERSAPAQNSADVEHASPSPSATPAEDYTDLWRRGDYKGALRELNALIGTMSRGVPPRFLYDRAELYKSVGNFNFAIRDMELLCGQISAPVYTLRLAEYYRDIGETDLFKRTLEEASRQAKNRWFYGAYEDNIVAVARIHELQGKNPRTILKTVLDPLIDSRPDYAGGYVAAGNLAAGKGDYGLALDYYKKGLSADVASQDALSGLVRCYFEMGHPQYEVSLEALKQINPNHPVGFEVRGEALIRQGRYEDALKVIDQGLKINPTQSRLLGLKSGVLFLLDRPKEMGKVQEAALEINSKDSSVFRITGEIADSRARYAESAEFEKRALVIDAEDHAAEAQLGFALLSLGEQKAGRERLDAAFKADPFNVRVFNMLKVLDTLDRYETRESGIFRLTLPPNEAPLLAPEMFALLGEASKALGDKYEVKFNPPVSVQMFEDHDDFVVRSIGFPGFVGLLGICTGPVVTMDSPSALPRGATNWKATLWHEFTHVVTLTKTHNRMSRWLSEGISVYEERQHDPAWGQRLEPGYKSITASEGMPKFSEMEHFFAPGQDGLHLLFGYFASGEFVEFYVQTYGFPALRESLDAIGQGKDTSAALCEAAGASPEQIDAGFADYMKHRLRKFENLPEIREVADDSIAPGDDSTTTTLENVAWAESRSPFTDAMKSAKSALEESKWDQAEALLRRAHELFPEYRGDDAPLRQLISLYDRLGRESDLKKALEERLASEEADFSAYRRYAQLLNEEKDWARLAEYARKSFGVDPFDVEMRSALTQAAMQLNQTDVALEQLDFLIRLDAPHASDHQLRRVNLLMKAGRWDQAHDEVFALLERLPYYWEAQEALLKIVERSKGASVDAATGGDLPSDASITL